SIPIRRMSYRTSRLNVSGVFTEPDATTLEQIGEEKELKNRVFSLVTETRLWSGHFVAPVNNAITEEFGVRRIFSSGRSRSRRSGPRRTPRKRLAAMEMEPDRKRSVRRGSVRRRPGRTRSEAGSLGIHQGLDIGPRSEPRSWP